ncbi:hypothetical protein HPB47_022286 [Ixodes persulcatus]|uniref:Uncharacterized protein n=1 Tax=Ixodes persulcatus TaxID=34615 RepID=A0AC60QA58_IXOPE|nr:hypothetical protein HPB47_022286 [Ixodes persulcatus]
MPKRSGQVQCGDCGKWRKLSETPFTTLEEAGDQHFRCTRCLDAIRELIETALKRERAEWEKVKTEWNKELEKEITARIAAETKMTEIQVEETKKREQMEKEITRIRAEMEDWRRGKKNRATDQQQNTVGDGADDDLVQDGIQDGDADREGTQRDHSPQPAGSREWHKIGSGGKVIKPKGKAQDEGKGTPSQEKSEKENRKKNPENSRRVLIIGDSNVKKMKRRILEDTGYDKRVTIKAVSETDTEQILKETEHWMEEKAGQDMILLHIWLGGIVEHGDAEGQVKKLEDTVNKWTEIHPDTYIGICSIPMATGDTREEEQKIRDANWSIKALCDKANKRVEFLNTFHRLKECKGGGMRGTHLNNEGGERIGEWLSRRTQAFLGSPLQDGRKRQGPQGAVQLARKERDILRVVQQALRGLRSQEKGPHRRRW